ncbi:MAG: ABC transporter substrate-binding protein [Pseudotabrizicola sp.]|uniref:ABC transporter substrate-binding protein n=3 Tax=Pseudotabrizicola sp. TaxID=2939647 RepID=UPI0027317676|nr:ABC transporter substrate-binding protein [Pseudotabrizicola sp.]MDP2082478.1 ABC transporter substrate-binding protein [Pseudotabrizicola sp.]MDZ7572784.1 ABC transporter substrate-binding protein [Pseudotabrizicola sp.]
MSDFHMEKSALTRRGLLKLGVGSVVAAAALGAGARIVMAQDGQVLKAIHPAFSQDWSPLRGGGVPFRWNSYWNASAMYFNESGEIQPYVLTEWMPNDDFTVWTFAVDPAATFADGSAITAADVKGSWELAAMPTSKNQRIDQVLSNVDGFAAVKDGTATDISGIVAGDGTLTVTLTGPDPIFFQRLANHIAPIVKASVARGADGAEVADFFLGANGATSGPFMLESADLDAGALVFVPNPNFFGPKPQLARIELTSVEDNVTATQMLKSGEYQAHTELVTSTMALDLGAGFGDGPTIPTSQHFWFNASRAPMDDPKVREALILAVDRDGLIKASFPDGPHQKTDMVMNSVPGDNDPAFVPYPFDPARAKQLLADSSYGGPEKLPKIMFVGISSPANEAAAQYIAEQWRQNLGIAAVDMKPQQDQYSGPDQNSIQIFRDDVGTRVPDAPSYLAGSIASTSGNAIGKMGGYKNDVVDAKITEALAKPADDPARVALAQEAQRAFRDDFMFLPWYKQTMSRWANANVTGIEKNLDWQVVAPWAITVG